MLFYLLFFVGIIYHLIQEQTSNILPPLSQCLSIWLIWKTVIWEDRKATDILYKKVEEVSFTQGDNDCYIDKSKDILKSTLNNDVPTVSDRDIDNI